MDYKKVAQEIYEKVGRKENLVSAAHCATRLRLVLVDNAKCDAKAVEDIEGVKGVFSASGQLQIILGTGVVNEVYNEFIAISGLSAATKDEVKAAAAARQNPFKRAIKTLGDIFVPIIPAIVASGFLMGIMEALNFMVNNGFLNIDTSGSIYVFANLFSNTAYTFLPILIAYSAAKAFGGNPYLGAVIGMMMIHPNLQNAWTVATEGVHQTQSVWFGLYSVDLVGYQGHVIPVIEEFQIAFYLCFLCMLVQFVEFQRIYPALQPCPGQVSPRRPYFFDNECPESGQARQDRGGNDLRRVIVPERGRDQEQPAFMVLLVCHFIHIFICHCHQR